MLVGEVMQDAEAALPYDQEGLIDVSNEAWAGKSRRDMTSEEKAAQDTFIRKLVRGGMSYNKVGQALNLSDDTVGRVIRNESKQAVIQKRCMKRMQCDIDLETHAQLTALSEHWQLSRPEVFRILLDWGIEALDGEEKDLCEKAAADCPDGQVL